MVCRGITPKYNTNSDETVLGQTCVRNNLVLLENGRLHSPKKVTEKWLQKYDLLINSTGVGSLGRTAQVWFEPTKLVVDSHVTIVRCNDKKHALYLGFWASGLLNMRSISSRFIREALVRQSFLAITLRPYALSSQAMRHWRGSIK